MGNFTPISRQPAKYAMKSAWVHSGALRAPLCIQGDVMAHFAGRREISHESSFSRPQKHTTHAPAYSCLCVISFSLLISNIASRLRHARSGSCDSVSAVARAPRA